jgi:SNF2 family DNA or RNA helicase
MELLIKETSKEGLDFLDHYNFNENIIQKNLLANVGLYLSQEATIFKTNNRQKEIVKSKLSWDILLNKQYETLNDTEVIHELLESDIKIVGLDLAEQTYQRKLKPTKLLQSSLEEFKLTKQYEVAYSLVDKAFGDVLADGSSLFEYQKECAAYIVGRRRLINGFDMGLGKTRTTIAGLVSNPSNKKILIVTMSRNIQDWETEIENLGLKDDYIILKNKADMSSPKRIHLVSYESWSNERVQFRINPDTLEPFTGVEFVRCPNCDRSFANKHSCSCGFTLISKRRKPLYKYFNRSYKAAAIDEGHLIKNGSTTRCKSIMAIKTPTRILLSGTPAEGGAADLFWPLAWVVGDKIQFWNKLALSKFEAYENFGERSFKVVYGGSTKNSLMDSKSIISRTSSTEDLWALLDKVMFRKLKTDEDVASEIRVPKPRHQRLHLPLAGPEKLVYDDLMEKFALWYKQVQEERKQAQIRGRASQNKSLEVAQWLEKLRRAASAPWLEPNFENPDNEELSKLTFVKNQITQMVIKGQKMLIFTSQKQTCKELGVLLNTLCPGSEVAYITGDVPMHRRKLIMKRFQDPKDSLNVLVMTMKVGAESYTLTQAKTVILWDLDYNAKKIEQCYSRAVRLGQRDEVSVIWLINVDTIDANMHSMILSKQSSVDLAIDRKSLDFKEISKEFEGQDVAQGNSIDYEAFATEMLSRGNSRSQYQSA